MQFAVYDEDSRGLRALSAMLLKLYPGGVVYELTNSRDLLSCIRSRKLDSVFLSLGGRDRTMGLLSRLRSLDTRVIVVALAEDDSLLEEAMWNGASAYLTKPLAEEKIRTALTGEEERIWK